jgi:hypothetical protein
VIGLIETVVAAVAAGLKLVRERRRAVPSPIYQLVAETRCETKTLLREIKLADASERALRRLASRVVTVYGGFELQLHELSPALFEEFRSPGIPSPVTLDGLRATVKDDLRRLKEIDRRTRWPVWLIRLRRARKRFATRVRERVLARVGRGW